MEVKIAFRRKKKNAYFPPKILQVFNIPQVIPYICALELTLVTWSAYYIGC